MPILEAFPEVLPCDALVFRAIKGGWMRGGELTSLAYMLRQFQDGTFEEGLSVGNNPENAIGQLTKIRRVDSLHVGKIRDLNLDVVPDTPTHAEITGLPIPDTVIGKLQAERLATALLIQSREINP